MTFGRRPRAVARFPPSRPIGESAPGLSSAKPITYRAPALAGERPGYLPVEQRILSLERSMKKLIQDLVQRHPIIKRNRLYYHIQRYRQYRPCRVDYSLTEHHDILDRLVENGIAVLDSYLDSALCDTIVSELDGAASQMLAGTYEGKSTGHPGKKAFRIGQADHVSATAKKHFFDDPMIHALAKAYVSKTAFSYRKEADFKLEAGHFLQADLPHFDDWRHRFKAFLYLTDVDAYSAPFVYYKGSQEQHPWKHKYHLEFERDGEEGRYGHFFIQEMRAILRERGYEELVCTGKAGTLILADFRGIHKGTTLREGRRILLNSTFGIALKGF